MELEWAVGSLAFDDPYFFILFYYVLIQAKEIIVFKLGACSYDIYQFISYLLQLNISRLFSAKASAIL